MNFYDTVANESLVKCSSQDFHELNLILQVNFNLDRLDSIILQAASKRIFNSNSYSDFQFSYIS